VHQCRRHGARCVQNLAGVSRDDNVHVQYFTFLLFYSVKSSEFLTSLATVSFLGYAERLSEVYWGIRKKSQGSSPSSSVPILSPVFPLQLANPFVCT
jgi:hypothetical protein